MNWTEPRVSDSSSNVTVRQTRGHNSGSSFRVGITEIRYTATELNGNKSPDCIFFVVVEGKAYVTLLSFLECYTYRFTAAKLDSKNYPHKRYMMTLTWYCYSNVFYYKNKNYWPVSVRQILTRVEGNIDYKYVGPKWRNFVQRLVELKKHLNVDLSTFA